MTEQERRSHYEALHREESGLEAAIVSLNEQLAVETRNDELGFLRHEILKNERALSACREQIVVYAPKTSAAPKPKPRPRQAAKA